jgi:hypothetical protein
MDTTVLSSESASEVYTDATLISLVDVWAVGLDHTRAALVVRLHSHGPDWL